MAAKLRAIQKRVELQKVDVLLTNSAIGEQGSVGHPGGRQRRANVGRGDVSGARKRKRLAEIAIRKVRMKQAVPVDGREVIPVRRSGGHRSRDLACVEFRRGEYSTAYS